jgi:hypothetical protein
VPQAGRSRMNRQGRINLMRFYFDGFMGTVQI